MTTLANKTKLLIDVDTGVDDAQAIIMALSKPSQVEVVGISCVDGNVHMAQTCYNTLRVLDLCGRLDVPVFPGCKGAIIPDCLEHMAVHGKDGLGDRPEQEPRQPPNLKQLQQEHAALAICRLAKQHEGELTLVAVGPLTNVATALKLDKDVGKNLKRIVVMGGNIKGQGNSSAAAEFNFWMDVEAAHACLAQLSLSMVSWELCKESGAMPWAWYDKMAAIDTPKGRFQRAINEDMVARRHSLWNEPHYYTCDPLAVAIAMDPSVVTASELRHVAVELHGQLTRGQCVVDWRDVTGKHKHVEVITQVDAKKVMLMFEHMLRS